MTRLKNPRRESGVLPAGVPCVESSRHTKIEVALSTAPAYLTPRPLRTTQEAERLERLRANRADTEARIAREEVMDTVG